MRAVLSAFYFVRHNCRLCSENKMTPPLGVLKEKHTHYCFLVKKLDFEKFLIGGYPAIKEVMLGATKKL